MISHCFNHLSGAYGKGNRTRTYNDGFGDRSVTNYTIPLYKRAADAFDTFYMKENTTKKDVQTIILIWYTQQPYGATDRN